VFLPFRDENRYFNLLISARSYISDNKLSLSSDENCGAGGSQDVVLSQPL
jgi:hypothetical protein